MFTVNRDCIQFKLVMKKNDKPFKGTEFPSTQVKKKKKRRNNDVDNTGLSDLWFLEE